MTTITEWRSRAVLRRVEAGNNAVCNRCDRPVRFTARVKTAQVICNVYVDGRWARVEHYHVTCYHEAGEPHGIALS
ncbi:MAG: hypothetical protein ACRD29_08400 [Acidimicrobiales bacterium]